ncbi:SGNH/GDSL hydrolase family protein [Lacimonas salitolerans]|uniref:SGNH/GDSL hydrolase family protein n=1 Tax=Lacimonas salitolerans TaxID=1323750 RepID=A0ABW4EDS6_9RHOB
MVRYFLNRLIAGLAMLLCLAAPLSAQGVERSVGPQARIIAIGDSLMAWNTLAGRSIPQIVAGALKEPVETRAVSGAHVIYNLPMTGAMGMRISAQFGKDSPDWVLVTGGGNDLWLGCGCSRCHRRMDRMVSPDGRKGAVPDLMRRIRATGAQVIYIGYLRSPGWTSIIDGCRDEGDAFEARLNVMARQIDGVHFLSNADLVPHGDTSFHAPDGIHPSIKGSTAIGQRVAALIRKLDARR